MEECTKEEIGVGAAIAAGSQAENGNCALFVIAAKNRNNMMLFISFKLEFRLETFKEKKLQK